MNTKLRLKNKVTLLSLLALLLALIYQVLGVFNITPSLTESQALEFIGIVLNLLVALGVLVDPTTAGIGDSTQALNYTEPRAKTIANDAVYSSIDSDYIHARSHLESDNRVKNEEVTDEEEDSESIKTETEGD